MEIITTILFLVFTSVIYAKPQIDVEYDLDYDYGDYKDGEEVNAKLPCSLFADTKKYPEPELRFRYKYS